MHRLILPEGSDFDSGDALAQDDADSRTEGSLKFAERRECRRTFARVILSGAKRNRTAKQCEANAEQDLGRSYTRYYLREINNGYYDVMITQIYI